MAVKVYKLAPGEFEKVTQHRPRILRCLMNQCFRKFPDKMARDKHMRDKHSLVRD